MAEPPPFIVYLPYLLFTYAVELPLVVLLLEKRCGRWRSLVAGLLASGLTHPLLWYVWPLVVPPTNYERWFRYVVSGELLVTAIETVIILVVAVRVAPGWGWGMRVAVAFGVALFVNAASLGLGMLTWLF